MRNSKQFDIFVISFTPIASRFTQLSRFDLQIIQAMRNRPLIISLTLICGLFLGCGDKQIPTPTFNFIKGADISWITEMESAGKKFYTTTGIEKDGFTLMKELGMNAIRLRVWVNPTDGWCGLTDLIAKAQRAQAAGLKLLIDFHYSDSWADPGKQFIPANWINASLPAMKDSVRTHTTRVLNELINRGITPTWVQIGNETNDGLLWPMGKASVSMSNYAALIQAGYQAVKAIDNKIQVVVHLSNGYDNNLFRWNLDGLRQYGAEWDIIGLSLYPTATDWQSRNQECLSNITDLITRYQKPIMICEIGMPWDQVDSSYSFISDLISKVKSIPNEKGLGVFYWEPQSYANWKGYTLGAFDNNGRPTAAMKAFQ